MRRVAGILLFFLLGVVGLAYQSYTVSWNTPGLERYGERLENLTDSRVPSTVYRILVGSSAFEFSRLSGLPVWVMAGTKNGTIYLQPLSLIKNVERTIAHELCHIFFSEYDLPYWVEEGLTGIITGEWLGFEDDLMNDLEDRILVDLSHSEYIRYSYTAWIRVSEIIRTSSFDNLIRDYGKRLE